MERWERVETRADFTARFADRVLLGEGLRFVIHGDGRMTGTAEGAVLNGTWVWRDGLFCRTAWLDGEPLGEDCETIEARGARMRYTRDGGRGAASVVWIADAG